MSTAAESMIRGKIICQCLHIPGETSLRVGIEQKRRTTTLHFLRIETHEVLRTVESMTYNMYIRVPGMINTEVYRDKTTAASRFYIRQ